MIRSVIFSYNQFIITEFTYIHFLVIAGNNDMTRQRRTNIIYYFTENTSRNYNVAIYRRGQPCRKHMKHKEQECLINTPELPVSSELGK